jgi:LacI family transcriptional regulator
VSADIENPYHGTMSKEIINTFEQHNYSVIVCNSNYDPLLAEKYIKMLVQKGIDGIILTTFMPTDHSLKLLQQRSIPIILLTIKTEDEKIDYIVYDDYLGGKLAAEYIVNLGHRRILFLRTIDVFSANERLRAFRNVLKRRKIPGNLCEVSNILWNQAESHREVNRRLQADFPFTAIIAANDYLAMGAMEAVYENRQSIPKDISLIGYDDLQFTSILRVPLTTVRQPSQEVGRIAAQKLLEKMAGNVARPIRITTKPQLIIRESCGKID